MARSLTTKNHTTIAINAVASLTEDRIQSRLVALITGSVPPPPPLGSGTCDEFDLWGREAGAPCISFDKQRPSLTWPFISGQYVPACRLAFISRRLLIVWRYTEVLVRNQLLSSVPRVWYVDGQWTGIKQSYLYLLEYAPWSMVTVLDEVSLRTWMCPKHSRLGPGAHSIYSAMRPSQPGWQCTCFWFLSHSY